MSTKRKISAFVIAPILAAGLLQAASFRTKDILKLNLTDSMPKGLYLMRSPSQSFIRRGDIIEFTPPGWTTEYIYRRHWLAEGTPLLKHVGAVPGDRVDITDVAISINGIYSGPVQNVDSQGLSLPALRGAFVVPQGYIFPLSKHIPNSFDGRYFGCISIAQIRNIAEPIFVF